MIDFVLIEYSSKVFIIFDLNLFTIDLNQCYSFFEGNFQVCYVLFDNPKQYQKDNGNQIIFVIIITLEFQKHHVQEFGLMENEFFQKHYDYSEYFADFLFLEQE